MSWTKEKIQEVSKTIREKVTVDAAFRQKCKTDINSVVEEVSGLQVPAAFKINVADLDAADLTIALPKAQTDELSDTDLESVAGGKLDFSKDNSADTDPDENGMLSGNDY